MSQSGEEEEERESEEKLGQEMEEVEPKADPEDSEPSASPGPSPIPSMEQAPKRDSWLWGLVAFPILSGLPWLGDRSKSLQEPVCTLLERKPSSTSFEMCPECEITFCKKCETLHFSPAFIEHGLLGHSERSPAESLSPTASTDPMDLIPALEEAEEETMEA